MPSKKKTTEQFVLEAIEVHGNAYRYDRVHYDGRSTKVEIWCPTCETYFWQAPNVHLRGHGHWDCHRGSGYGSYNYTTVTRNPDRPMEVYYLSFSKGLDICYKVGIEQPGNSRWGYTCRGWTITEIERYASTLYDCYCMEQSILMKNEEYIGIPEELDGVSGHTEFFLSDISGGNSTFLANVL